MPEKNSKTPLFSDQEALVGVFQRIGKTKFTNSRISEETTLYYSGFMVKYRLMDVSFGDKSLDRLETDPKFDAGFSPAIVSAFRKRMQVIRMAPDERVFYGLRSLHFEKLKGARSHQYSMRLNDQWRLIIEFHQEAERKVVRIIAIEDYH